VPPRAESFKIPQLSIFEGQSAPPCSQGIFDLSREECRSKVGNRHCKAKVVPGSQQQPPQDDEVEDVVA
jgi:hypothetical protein